MMYNWMDMSGYGLSHFLVFAVMVALILYPIGRILSRIGLSPFWSVLVLVPFVNLIALWVLAFSEWPSSSGRSSV